MGWSPVWVSFRIYREMQGRRGKEAEKVSERKHLFSRRALWGLLLPLIVEQIFTALMGTADTMMVAQWAMRR